MTIREVDEESDLWPRVAGLFPEAVKWRNDPEDHGQYHFLSAADEDGNLIGASVIDIGDLAFGPLASVRAGFLENIEVLKEYRRNGIGTELLRATLELAWRAGCESVRSTVDYDNGPALALYRAQGLGFVPEEDPAAEEQEESYSIISINPDRVRKGYGRRQDNR